MKKFYKDYKIYVITWIIITILAEGIFLKRLLFTDSNIIIVGGILIIPVAIFLFLFILTSIENSFYSIAIMLPLLPVSGYISLRLGIIDYQWIFYLFFYCMFLASLIKNKFYLKMDFNKLKSSKSVLFFAILMLLIFVNVLLAFNKSLSIIVFLFGFLPFTIYFCLAGLFEPKDRNLFLQKFILCITLGVVLSCVPDFIYWTYLVSFGMRIYRLYGPLGSNFILGYSLIFYPIIISKLKSSKILYKKIYWVLFVIQSISLSSQFSRGAFLCVLLVFILLLSNNINRKICIISLCLVLGFMSIDVFQRSEISNNSAIQSNAEHKLVKVNPTEYISSQSENRVPLWKAAIKMFKDYPVMGVGLGNYRYFYTHYSGIKRPYSDAHNFILNSLAELGIVITIMILACFIIIAFKIYRKSVKEKDIENKKVLIGFLIGLIAFFIYGNVTGVALQNPKEIHSYTPTFAVIFIIFYSWYLLNENQIN